MHPKQEDPIRSSDSVELAIWKVMSDFKYRTLEQAANELYPHGFNRRVVKDTMLALFRRADKAWFQRRQPRNGGKYPEFMLQPRCPRPERNEPLEPGIIASTPTTIEVPFAGVLREQLGENPQFTNLNLSHIASVVAKVSINAFGPKPFTAEDIRCLLQAAAPEAFQQAKGDTHPTEFASLVLERAVQDGGICVFDMSDVDSSFAKFPRRYSTVIYAQACRDLYQPELKAYEYVTGIGAKKPAFINELPTDEQVFMRTNEVISAFLNSTLGDSVFTQATFQKRVQMAITGDVLKKLTTEGVSKNRLAARIFSVAVKEGTIREYDVYAINPNEPRTPARYVVSEYYDAKIDAYLQEYQGTQTPTPTSTPKESPTMPTKPEFSFEPGDPTIQVVIKALAHLGESSGIEVLKFLLARGYSTSQGAVSGCLSRNAKQGRFKSRTRTDHTGSCNVYSLADVEPAKPAIAPAVASSVKPVGDGVLKSMLLRLLQDLEQATLDALQSDLLRSGHSIHVDAIEPALKELVTSGRVFTQRDCDGTRHYSTIPFPTQPNKVAKEVNHPIALAAPAPTEIPEAIPSTPALDSSTESDADTELVEISVRIKGRAVTQQEIAEIVEVHELLPRFDDLTSVRIMVQVLDFQVSHAELGQIVQRLQSLGIKP